MAGRSSQTLTIIIAKPIEEVFSFCITPPNSSRWIPGVVAEKTNEWPVKVGTIYSLQGKSGEWSEVAVAAIEPNKSIEWISPDGIYHCRYTFQSLDTELTELAYREWVDSGTIEDPFTPEILQKLKEVIEADKHMYY